MKYREHRGGLWESMQTVKEFVDLPSFVAHIKQWCEENDYKWFDGILKMEYYCGYDDRIDWEQTWAVKLQGIGIIGFTDGVAYAKRTDTSTDKQSVETNSVAATGEPVVKHRNEPS